MSVVHSILDSVGSMTLCFIAAVGFVLWTFRSRE